MDSILILGILLVGLLGLFTGAVAFREYTRLTKTAEKVSAWWPLRIAAGFGVAGGLVLFTMVLVAGVLEEHYVWSLSSIVSSMVISLIVGALITVGAAYQVYTTLAFKDMLIRKNKKPENTEKHGR